MPLRVSSENAFRLLAETGEAWLLMEAFVWRSSPQGSSYWANQYSPHEKRIAPEAWEQVRMMYVEWVVCDRDVEKKDD